MVNGQLTNYTFKIVLNNKLNNGDYMFITSPVNNSITFSSNT